MTADIVRLSDHRPPPPLGDSFPAQLALFRSYLKNERQLTADQWRSAADLAHKVTGEDCPPLPPSDVQVMRRFLIRALERNTLTGPYLNCVFHVVALGMCQTGSPPPAS